MQQKKSLLSISLIVCMCGLVIGCGQQSSETSEHASTAQVSHKQNATQRSETYENEVKKLTANITPIHAPQNPDAIAKLPKSYKFVNDGYFTVATSTATPPLGVLAPDNKTFVGTEIDIARLIADSLGLKLKIVKTSFEDWPLGVSGGRYDAAMTNLTVTKERKQKFDFATYRRDVLAFYVAENSKIKSIKGPDDIAGLKILVNSGTNQEKILLDWIEDNKKKGLTPAQVQYIDDAAAAQLALQSGRLDAIFGPNVAYAWQATNGRKIRPVGTALGGGDKPADIGVAVKKGNGLAEPINIALNGVIQSGQYHQVLQRWGDEAEAIEKSEINPAGLGD
ncbi:MAG: ABC transporter substrate-binding protein [Acinetobacter sp.]